MPRLLLLILLTHFLCACIELDSNENRILASEALSKISDVNFAACIELAVPVKYVDQVTSISCLDNQISNIDGIENYTSLTNLHISNGAMTEVDLSNNTELASLYLHGPSGGDSIALNQNVDCLTCALTSPYPPGLTSIDLSRNLKLTFIDLGSNRLTNLDLRNNTALTTLYLLFNPLTSVQLGNNTALKSLTLNSDQLTNIDLSRNTALINLLLSCDKLENVDLSSNIALTVLYLDVKQLTSVSLNDNTKLSDLYLGGEHLISVDLSENTELKTLQIMDTPLSNLDISNNTMLQQIGLTNNKLTSIDLSENSALFFIDLSGNELTTIPLGLPEINDTSALITLSDNPFDDNAKASLSILREANSNLVY